MTSKRLAVVTTHPIQYQAPWFRALAAHPQLDLEVYFCQNATAKEQANAGFNVEFQWDIPILEGYPFYFLRNIAPQPSIGGFWGLDVPEIRDIIHREHFDALLVSGWNYKGAWQAFFASWSAGTPVMVRGDSNLITRRTLLKQILKYPLYHAFISKFDACLAVGKWSQEYFRHYGARSECIFNVPHVIDEAWFGRQLESLWDKRQALRRDWNIPCDKFVFLYCGKLTEQKRPLDFINAINRASTMNPNIMGVIVGDGPLRSVCEQAIESHRIAVKFIGFLNQSEIIKAYLVANTLVLPGGETWGLVVNEAMFSGRPCIVSDQVGAGPDLIIPDKTGDIYPLGDITALAALMLKYADNIASSVSMGEAACTLLQTRYSMDTAVSGVIEALEKVGKT